MYRHVMATCLNVKTDLAEAVLTLWQQSYSQCDNSNMCSVPSLCILKCIMSEQLNVEDNWLCYQVYLFSCASILSTILQHCNI
jgi:hypothetical protein